VRFRGYKSGMDIDRIKTQQEFLKTLASQMLTISNVSKVKDWIKIFKENVTTNLSASNLLWLGQEMMKIPEGGLVTGRVPANDFANIRGASYVSIYPDEWLTVINEQLSPFYQPITMDNLDILTWDSAKGYGITSGGQTVQAAEFAGVG